MVYFNLTNINYLLFKANISLFIRCFVLGMEATEVKL